MRCDFCNAEIKQNDNFCPECGKRIVFNGGAAIDNGNNVDNNYYDPTPQYQQTSYYADNTSYKMTEKCFFSEYSKKSVKGINITVAVLCFLSACIAVPQIVTFGNLLGIIDIVVFVLFGVLVLIKKKWYFSLIISIYCGLACALALTLNGVPTGIILLMLAIGNTVSLYRINKAYITYVQTGQMPQMQIG